MLVDFSYLIHLIHFYCSNGKMSESLGTHLSFVESLRFQCLKTCSGNLTFSSMKCKPSAYRHPHFSSQYQKRHNCDIFKYLWGKYCFCIIICIYYRNWNIHYANWNTKKIMTDSAHCFLVHERKMFLYVPIIRCIIMCCCFNDKLCFTVNKKNNRTFYFSIKIKVQCRSSHISLDVVVRHIQSWNPLEYKN